MNTAEDIETTLDLDENGLLTDPQEWDENIARMLASQAGIPILTSEHWEVIHALRAHYEKFGVAPAMHNICHTHGKADNWVHDLFQSCIKAWRISGLPDPGEESRAYLNDM